MKTTLTKVAYAILIALIISTNLFQGSVAALEDDGPPPDKGGTERGYNPETGRVAFIGGDIPIHVQGSSGVRTAAPQDKAMLALETYGPEFGLQNPAGELQVLKTRTDENGRTVTRYQQVYKGIPVFAGELIVNMNENGDLLSMSGEVSPELSLSISPAVYAAEASQTALGAIAKWHELDEAELVVSEPELWIFDESLLKESTRAPELVWRMEVSATDANRPIRELVLVNAQTGGISLHYNQVHAAWSGSAEQSELQQTGTTWYVATTGDDTNDCQTTTTPCETINGAIGKASDGDTIKVSSGTYTSTSSTVVSISKHINLSGGWDSTFVVQTGETILDGEDARTVMSVGGTVVIERFTIINGSNFPTGDSGGGGIKVRALSNITLNASSIHSNKAKNGGGIYVSERTTLTLNNTTVSGNEATYYGGGIAAPTSGSSDDFPTIVINNSTITDNTAWHGGGIDGLYITLNNSILAGNIATYERPDCGNGITSAGHNILGGEYCENTPQTGDLIGIDPRLDTLSPEGFHALLLDSPAIDAANPGTCPATDQRGVARPVGSGCDIGAYEVDIFPPSAPSSVVVQDGSPQHTAVSTSFSELLSALVLDQYGIPFEGATVTFTAPASGASGSFSDSGNSITTAISDTNGIATAAVFTANADRGAYTVDATLSGVTSTAQFELLNNFIWYVSNSGNDSNNCQTTSTPCGTINGTIEKSNSGDAIYVTTGSFSGSSPTVITINKDIFLVGGWDSTYTAQTGLTTVAGQGIHRGAIIYAGVTADIDNFIFIDGKAQHEGDVGYGPYCGGGILNLGHLTLNNSIFSNNIASYGGGIFNNESATLTLENSHIKNNSASAQGGGVFNRGTMIINSSTVSVNNSDLGGGILSEQNLEMNNSTISGNAATSGGGIYRISGSAIINNNTITDNVATATESQFGGGLYSSNNDNLVIKNSIVAGNSAYESPDCHGQSSGQIISEGYNLIGDSDEWGVVYIKVLKNS